MKQHLMLASGKADLGLRQRLLAIVGCIMHYSDAVPENIYTDSTPRRLKLSRLSLLCLQYTALPVCLCITVRRAGGERLGEATQFKTTGGGEGGCCPFLVGFVLCYR